MISAIFLLLTLCCYLWSSSELAEISSYWNDVEYYLKSWPVCRIYSSQEIENSSGESLTSHMKSMNNIVHRYNKFKSKYEDGIDIANQTKTRHEVESFVEVFDTFESEIENYSQAEIEEMYLKYCGVFLANPRLISPFSGDRTHGVPYYKGITDFAYFYLKLLKEDIEYVAGRLGRYTDNMIKLKVSCLIM